MHRLARGFVIQGGGYYPSFVQEPAPLNVSLDPNAQIDLDGNLATPNPTIVNEHNTSPVRSNTRGTIAMAQINGQPNSASNQWFVNLADNSSSLDSLNFTVFGQVAGDGMAMFDAFNTLSITNLNPDTNDDGTRDDGPFFNYNASTDSSGNPTDGVPYLHGTSQDILVVINQAKQVDYLGANLVTTSNFQPFISRPRRIHRHRHNIYWKRNLWVGDWRGANVGYSRRIFARPRLNERRYARARQATGLDYGAELCAVC